MNTQHFETEYVNTARLLHTRASVPVHARRQNKPKARRRLWHWLAGALGKSTKGAAL